MILSESSDSDLEDVPSKRFRSLEEEVANVNKGGRQKSKHSETWAEHLWQDWLKAEGKPCSLSIADHYESEKL
ncbi:hypothetical protein R1flu_002840 [Riccia fluitans]|uniref:Uncharacterized protein n=1 Tax=Riccia fluitans TaxID=41844 RepID=A0ABD1Y7B1_9MARC